MGIKFENKGNIGNDTTHSVTRSYFHELSQEQIDKLIADKKNWGYIMNKYKQPDWCTYPNALNGEMGCWSLIDLQKNGLRTKISKAYCKDCECFHDVFLNGTYCELYKKKCIQDFCSVVPNWKKCNHLK